MLARGLLRWGTAEEGSPLNAPPAVDVDMTLACCPACSHERLTISTEQLARVGVTRLVVTCACCAYVEPLGWATRRAQHLFPWALRRWGLQ